MENKSSITRANATAKPRIHHFGGLRLSTMWLILSVTEPKSCPGPRIGADAICSASLSAGLSAMGHFTLDCSHLLDFRVRVSQPRLVCCPRPRIQFLKKFVIPILRLQER